MNPLENLRSPSPTLNEQVLKPILRLDTPTVPEKVGRETLPVLVPPEGCIRLQKGFMRGLGVPYSGSLVYPDALGLLRSPYYRRSI